VTTVEDERPDVNGEVIVPIELARPPGLLDTPEDACLDQYAGKIEDSLSQLFDI
jgi:hypothetical protein